MAGDYIESGSDTTHSYPAGLPSNWASQMNQSRTTGSLNMNDGSAYEVDMLGDTAFVLSDGGYGYDDGINIIDLTNPASPNEISFIRQEFSTGRDKNKIITKRTSSGSYLYTIGGISTYTNEGAIYDSLIVYDVSDLSNVNRVSSVANMLNSQNISIVSNGDYIFIASINHVPNNRSYLMIYSIASPSSPVFVDSLFFLICFIVSIILLL